MPTGITIIPFPYILICLLCSIYYYYTTTPLSPLSSLVAPRSSATLSPRPGTKKIECTDDVMQYLDREIPGWRDESNSRKGINRAIQLQKAREIVERYKQRGGELPRKLADRSEPDREQQYKDAQKLTKWKQTLKGNGNSKYNCPGTHTHTHIHTYHTLLHIIMNVI